MSRIKARLGRLESAAGHSFPFHLPTDQWTDEQLMRFLMVSNNRHHELTDAELEAVARGEP